MKNMIYPSAKVEFTQSKLQDETRKRMIPLLPADGLKMPLGKYLALRVKMLIKKILNLI